MSVHQRDSVVSQWYEKTAIDAFDNYYNEYICIDTTWAPAVENVLPDSIYEARLKAMISPIHLPYNEVVRNYIVRYTSPTSGLMSRVLGLSQYYFPMIEQELINAGLPVELRALPIIESALQPTAKSRAAAVGLWQFVYATGKAYGLEINSFVDERCDPLQSTRAACKYLKDLYRTYGDWSLALAAYNCGPGNVNKAIARAGVRGSFWDIYNHLPRETRGYVPAFIAATYAYNYYTLHGIEITTPPMPMATDTIMVSRVMHLEQVASTIDIPIETLRRINPQYRLDIIPASTKSYPLMLPVRDLSHYIINEDSIMAKDSLYLKEYLDPAKVEKKRVEENVARTITHVVKRGETLGGIARRYGVTTRQIMQWNNLKNANTLRIGQRLRIQRRR
jgi:membrane-bound lytic murein transglycosylase D